MAKTMAINYPTQEWLDKWMDRYCDQHPNEKIEDWDALKEQAEQAWWDNEIDHDRPTPFDLTEEQKKVAQEARKGMARAVNAFGKEVKRVRKPNEDKREIISTVAQNLSRVITEDDELAHEVEISNVERQIDFVLRGVHYSLTLTAHRPPKSQ